MIDSRTKLTSSRHRGFTAIELLVVIGIVVLLLAIFVPYAMTVRESDRRVRCAANLRQIRDALKQYADENARNLPRVVYDAAHNPNGYTCYTGADADDPFSAKSAVKPNDVTASLWLLMRDHLISDPRVFVCPSSSGVADDLTDGFRRPVDPKHRGNFRTKWNLTYSYASPFSNAYDYRLNSDALPASFAIMADMNPGDTGDGNSITGPAHDAPPLVRARANSNNHQKAGQNVLYADGNVAFETSVYCGVGRDPEHNKDGDNIYTALAPKRLEGQKPPADGNGYWGPTTGPSWQYDSYLVPTEQEGPR